MTLNNQSLSSKLYGNRNSPKGLRINLRIFIRCLFFFLMGFFVALSCYTMMMTSFAILTPDSEKPDKWIWDVRHNGAPAAQNSKTDMLGSSSLGTSHFPSHCLPFPGEDHVVEGSHPGFRLLLLIQKSLAEQAYTPLRGPRILCMWEYMRTPSTNNAREVVDYLSSQCTEVWVMHEPGSEPVHLKDAGPNIRLWSSTASSSSKFLSSLSREMKEMKWLVIAPHGFYVILESLRLQLSGLSPALPLTVAAGFLSDIHSGKPAQKKPDATCGWVYSSAALQQLSNLPPLGTLQDALQEALRGQDLPCTTEKELPFTFVNISAYTKADHWRRLHSAIHGSCNRYWNTALGAKDADGQWGYVHDPTSLKRHSHPFNMSLSCCKTKGLWYDGTREALGKIEIAPPHPRTKRVLCMVYTHSNRHEQIRAIAETWGRRCDGFMAASNVTDPSLGAVNLWHEGPEVYDNMWLKVRSMVSEQADAVVMLVGTLGRHSLHCFVDTVGVCA